MILLVLPNNLNLLLVNHKVWNNSNFQVQIIDTGYRNTMNRYVHLITDWWYFIIFKYLTFIRVSINSQYSISYEDLASKECLYFNILNFIIK
jgi:hypothetical protein